MKSILTLLFFIACAARAEMHIPAFTAYFDPDPNGAGTNMSKDHGIEDWTNPKITIAWFGEMKTAGKLTASVVLRLPKAAVSKLSLTVGKQTLEASATGTGEPLTIKFGEYTIEQPGYARFQLASLNPAGQPAGSIDELLLDGPAVIDAHFNILPRRNAASVHLVFPTPPSVNVAGFYNEAIGVEEPLWTYYMVCGFSRGYFGMQINSPVERRIIFSTWDAGGEAVDRKKVNDENRVKLLAKGEGVVANDFGNEGTGGHSHLIYPWKTGDVQKFYVAVKAEGEHTDYSGYWFHPEQKKWMLIASFRAPKDGQWLHGLYSFSENFGGSNGHLPRKALYGPQWIRIVDGPNDEKGTWKEITDASFSHDGTGKSARLDRFMGVERGMFFLSQGGFVSGFTKSGEKFSRPATRKPPELDLPKVEAPK